MRARDQRHESKHLKVSKYGLEVTVYKFGAKGDIVSTILKSKHLYRDKKKDALKLPQKIRKPSSITESLEISFMKSP